MSILVLGDGPGFKLLFSIILRRFGGAIGRGYYVIEATTDFQVRLGQGDERVYMICTLTNIVVTICGTCFTIFKRAITCGDMTIIL